MRFKKFQELNFITILLACVKQIVLENPTLKYWVKDDCLHVAKHGEFVFVLSLGLRDEQYYLELIKYSWWDCLYSRSFKVSTVKEVLFIIEQINKQ